MDNTLFEAETMHILCGSEAAAIRTSLNRQAEAMASRQNTNLYCFDKKRKLNYYLIQCTWQDVLPHSRWPKFIIFVMKVAFYFLQFLMVSFGEAKNQRFMFSRKHHDKVKHHGWTMGIKETIVRYKMCNAQTCIKCLNVFATSSNISGVPQKTKLSCAYILKLHNCCPKKLLKMF